MSYVQQPCVCGGTSFQVLPNIQIHYGGTAHASASWSITAVVCAQCTRTEIFTENADQVARHVTGRMMVAGPQ